MDSRQPAAIPSRHTPQGGVLVGPEAARRRLVLFEDPQCPYCRQFEETSGDVLRHQITSGSLAVEYRMRCFLGPESVRADNALALAAEVGRFDELRKELFAAQPPENSGGFTVADLIELGRRAGVADSHFESGVREGRYEAWVEAADRSFQQQDPRGTPAGLLDGRPVDPGSLLDPAALGTLLRS